MAFPAASVKHLLEESTAPLPCGDGDLPGDVRQVQVLEGPGELVLQVAKHAHAVLDLGEVLVKLQGRDGQPGQEVELVGGVDRAAAPLPAEFLPPALQLGHGLQGPRPVEGGEGVQALPVAGEAHGHTGHAEEPLPQGEELLQSEFQGRTVVEAGAQDDLAVEPDAALCQAVQVAQGVPGEAVAHHLAAELRVHGVHRHVNGRDAHLQNAVDLPVVDIGEGDVVAEQEGEPVVVVLEIEGLPHAFGQLVDKAEHTLVPAGALPVHEVGLKFQAQAGVLGLGQVYGEGLSRPGEPDPQFLLCLEKAVVQHVHDLVAVEGHQHVPRLDAQPLGPAARLYPGDCYRHGASSSLPREDRKEGNAFGRSLALLLEIYASFFTTTRPL